MSASKIDLERIQSYVKWRIEHAAARHKKINDQLLHAHENDEEEDEEDGALSPEEKVAAIKAKLAEIEQEQLHIESYKSLVGPRYFARNVLLTSESQVNPLITLMA